MKYTVNRLDVIGRIWMPSTVYAMTYTLSEYDLGNIRDYGDGTITREGISNWVAMNCGDFQEIIDFACDFGDNEFESTWESEENEMTFMDCMYPEDFE